MFLTHFIVNITEIKNKISQNMKSDERFTSFVYVKGNKTFQNQKQYSFIK